MPGSVFLTEAAECNSLPVWTLAANRHGRPYAEGLGLLQRTDDYLHRRWKTRAQDRLYAVPKRFLIPFLVPFLLYLVLPHTMSRLL